MIRHGYDPSASNSWAVFLMSDNDPASFANGAAVNGFAVGVNLTGYDDTLRLWKIKKGSISVVAVCPVNWQNDIGDPEHAKIVVERSKEGDLEHNNSMMRKIYHWEQLPALMPNCLILHG